MSSRSFLLLCKLAIVLSAVLADVPAFAEKRAFVVGIDVYPSLGPHRQLERAVNDAEAVAEALEALGFAVTLRKNTTQSDFFYEFDAFNRSIKSDDIVAFYYSGHGVQIRGQNYLLPSDTPPPERTVEELIIGRSIQMNSLLEQLGRNNPAVRFLIIDACRNNPYQAAGRSVGNNRGLASVEKVNGTFVMFSAGAGQTALDKLTVGDNSKNSPYTRALLPLLRTKGQTLPDIARRVRYDVEQLVAKVPHDQSPAYYDGISGDFCLTGDCKSSEQLRQELENLRQEEARQREQLQRLQDEARSAVRRTEDAERRAADLSKQREFVQRAAQDVNEKGGQAIAALTLPPNEPVADDKAAKVQLTRQIQTRLQQQRCYSGPIDGVWGVAVKASLARFSARAKLEIGLDSPTQSALTVLASRGDPVCAPERTEAPEKPKRVTSAPIAAPARERPARQAKPDALSYSMNIWGRGVVPDGATVSTTTPLGRLTCIGGNINRGKPRSCRWN
jgi:hypothetical protein